MSNALTAQTYHGNVSYMPYLDLPQLGIKTFRLHRIKAFCPETEALRILSERCSEDRAGFQDGFGTHFLHERPDYQNGAWSPSPSVGFAPTFAVGRSAASAVGVTKDGHCIGRLLRQGVGILTEAFDTDNEEELVEKEPSTPAPANEGASCPVLEKLARGLGIEPDKLVKRVNGDFDKQLIEDTSYEVVEIVFKSKEFFELIIAKGLGRTPTKLRKAIVYFLLRSYDMDPTAATPPALERLSEEVNLDALSDLVVVGRDNAEEEITLKNLSQSNRGFVMLGPRGAVIAYAEDYMHPRLRISAINMIEILRGRHFNLIMARVFADDTIRELSRLAHLADGAKVNYESEIPKLLDKIMLANYLYGLVVSDPGVFLLDGSTLTRLAHVADTWLNLFSLRVDTERKMEALYRLWQHFQDRQRIHIIGSLSRRDNAGQTK